MQDDIRRTVLFLVNGFGVDNTIRDALAALVEKGYNLDMIQETLNLMKGV